MIGTISIGGEKAVAAYDHYDAIKGVDQRPVVWSGPYGFLYMAGAGEVQDEYRNRVLDLPIDPVLATIEDIAAYVADAMSAENGDCHD